MSTPSSRRRAAGMLVALVVLASLACLREADRRSLRGVDARGVIAAIETRTEKHPGHDDRHFIVLSTPSGPQEHEIGADVVEHARVGAVITPSPDGDGVILDGERVRLPPQAEPRALALALSCGLAWLPLVGAMRRLRGAQPGASTRSQSTSS